MTKIATVEVKIEDLQIALNLVKGLQTEHHWVFLSSQMEALNRLVKAAGYDGSRNKLSFEENKDEQRG